MEPNTISHAIDWPVIITIIASTLTIIGANLGFSLCMFLWLRSEANNERRECTRLIFDLTNSMLDESKEFHGKICSLEERNRK